jgi:hypothetical protein
MSRSTYQSRFSDDDDFIIGIPNTKEWQYRRLETINNQEEPIDPWGKFFPSNFHLTAKQILDRARQMPPLDPVSTVSGFTSWIYSLYSKDINYIALKEGADAEDEILEARGDWVSYSEFRNFKFTSWHQLHCGMGTKILEDRRHNFLIPSLKVNGYSLRANPDLVFVHEDTGDIILIEVKFSMAQIPYNLWPNVWAQLWAYSKIPTFENAPQIIAIGEIWGENSGKWKIPQLSSSIYLRRSVRRNPRCHRFDKFFTNLFAIYSGLDWKLKES